MYLRDTDFSTLEDVAGLMTDRRQTWSGSSTAVSVLVHEEPQYVTHTDDMSEAEHEQADANQRLGTVRFGEHEVPMTRTGMQVLAQYYEIPAKFLERVTPAEQQFILSSRIQRTADTPLVLKYGESGLGEAYLATRTRIDPADIAERLMEQSVMPPEAMVVEWWNTPEDFRLDVIVPADYDKGIGGDAKVGDLTHGGLRLGQNRKQNLAPWVQPYTFRLVCTNGMEVPDLGMKIDARNAEEHDIIQMLMAEARRAMDRVDDDIKHFYDLRTVTVEDDHTGLFRRLAREQGLPERTIGHMENILPDALMAQAQVTMFDLLNHLTNQANDPNIRSQHNVRRNLERAGGAWVNDHAARCDLCHSRLN